MSHFSLRTSPSPSGEPQLIISVSKKVAKKAVTRNLIKRRVRAVFRDMSPQRLTYLLIARAGAETVRGEELRKELESLIK
jgi:ribonuclease P protein component